MKSYFLPRLSAEQKQRLNAQSVSFYDFTLGDEVGVVLQEQSLQNVLTLLELRCQKESDTAYEGIVHVRTVSANVVPNPELELAPSVSAGIWHGCNKEGMLAIARQTLQPYLQKDIVIDSPRAAVQPVKGKKFHIHFYSAAARTNGCSTPGKIWGVPSSSADGSWSRTGNGIAFYDGDYAVAELVGGNNLYIHHDLAKTGNKNEEMIFSLLLERVVKHIVSEQSETQSRRLFVDLCSRYLATEANLIEDQSAESLLAKIRELKKDLKKASRIAAEEELVVMRNHKFRAEEAFAAEYDALLKVPKVTDVRVENGVIVVFTEILFAKDPRTNKFHEVGAFKILLNPGRKDPLWYNQTRLVQSFADRPMQGVHIFNDGHACLGNAEAIFASLFSQREWALAAQVAIEFAESVNQVANDRAGLQVHQWPTASAEDIAARDERISRPRELSEAQIAYRKEYVQACADRVTALINSSLTMIADLRKETEKLQVKLISALRARQVKLKMQARKKLCNRDDLAAAFDALLQTPKVTGVRVDNRSISVFTEMLYCTCPKTKEKYEIGKFRIKINLDGSSDCVRWFNLSRQVNACKQKQQAPRVLNSGRAYFDDIREAFPDLIADFNIALVVQLAIDFVEQIDSNDPHFAHLTQWPKASS